MCLDLDLARRVISSGAFPPLGSAGPSRTPRLFCRAAWALLFFIFTGTACLLFHYILAKSERITTENMVANENEVRQALLQEEHALRLRLMKEDHVDRLRKRRWS